MTIKCPIEKYMRRKISVTQYEAKKRRDLEFNIDHNDLIKLWKDQKGLCAISKNKLQLEHGGLFRGKHNPYSCTIDRIDNSRGYLKDNIQLVTCAHNFWRSDMPLSEYKKLLGKYHEVQVSHGGDD